MDELAKMWFKAVCMLDICVEQHSMFEEKVTYSLLCIGIDF